jgi:choline dehydrogenase
VKHGVRKYARVSREIIVSAGSLESPKLLMLSGIGISKDLKDIGVMILLK